MKDNSICQKNLNENKKRIKWIDSLKGFLMLLVVMGHVLDGYINAETFPQYSEQLKIIYNIIYSFHMPCFMAVSGYLFGIAYSVKEDNTYKIKVDRVKRQIINIVMLYFIWSLFLGITKICFSSDVNSAITYKDLLLLGIKPFNPFWYFYNLIEFYLIFIFVKFKKIYLPFLAILSGLSMILPSGIFFALNNFCFYLFFFCLGFYIEQIKIKPYAVYLAFIFSIALLSFSNILNVNYQEGILKLLIAFGITLMLFDFFKKVNSNNSIGVCEFIGKRSLEIYVVHCFFTAGNRVLLPKILHLSNVYINIITNFLISILLSVFAVYLCKRIKLYDYFFRPIKIIERINNNEV